MARHWGISRGGRLLVPLAIFCAAPVEAVPDTAGRADVQADADAEALAEAQLTAFGARLNRANEIQLRAQAQVMGLGPAFQRTSAERASLAASMGRLRAVLQEAQTAIETARVVRGQILASPSLSRAVAPMRQFRMEMDAVTIRQNQALATAP